MNSNQHTKWSFLLQPHREIRSGESRCGCRVARQEGTSGGHSNCIIWSPTFRDETHGSVIAVRATGVGRFTFSSEKSKDDVARLTLQKNEDFPGDDLRG